MFSLFDLLSSLSSQRYTSSVTLPLCVCVCGDEGGAPIVDASENYHLCWVVYTVYVNISE